MLTPVMIYWENWLDLTHDKLAENFFLCALSKTGLLFIFVIFKQHFYRKTVGLCRIRTRTIRRRRRACWPLVHHQDGPYVLVFLGIIVVFLLCPVSFDWTSSYHHLGVHRYYLPRNSKVRWISPRGKLLYSNTKNPLNSDSIPILFFYWDDTLTNLFD